MARIAVVTDYTVMGILRSAEWYDEMYGDAERAWRYREAPENTPWVPIWEWVTRRLQVKFPMGARILDVGCGPGQFAQYISSKMPIDYVGLDFSEEALRQARERTPQHTYIQADINEPNWWPKDHAPFDAVVMTEVLEHVRHDVDTLRAIPSKNEILFSVPTYDDPSHVRIYRSGGDFDRWKLTVQFRVITTVVRAGKPAVIWVGEAYRL